MATARDIPYSQFNFRVSWDGLDLYQVTGDPAGRVHAEDGIHVRLARDVFATADRFVVHAHVIRGHVEELGLG